MQHKLLKLENKVHRGKPGQTPTQQHQENMKYFAKGVPVAMSVKEIGELPFYISEHKGVNTGYLFGEVENNHRNDKNMINKDLLVYDLDDVPGDIFDELVQGLKAQGINAVVHTSFSHKLEGKGNRLRVIAETSRTMTPDEYPTAVDNFIDDVPVLKKYKQYIDNVSRTKSQFYLAPSHPPGMEQFARKEYINGGTPYIPDIRKRTVDNISSSKVEPLLVSSPPQTPRTVSQVQHALSMIPADCSYDIWRNVIWSVLSTGWTCSIDLAMAWSKTAPGSFNAAVFYNIVHGYDPSRKDSPTLGTIYYLANKGGLSYIPNTRPNKKLKEHKKEIVETVNPFENFQEEYKEGTRNVSLTREVADLFQLSNDFNEVNKEAHKLNQLKCVPPLDIKEVDGIVKSISKQERFQDTPSEADGMFKDLEIFNLSWDSLTIAPPERKWLLDGFMPQGIVGGIVATGGTGKSLFSLQLCISVASGMALYNLWSTTNYSKVVYISGEETYEEVIRRMFYLCRGMTDVFRKRVIDNISIISFADQFYSFIQKDRFGNVIITSVVEALVKKLLSHIKDPIGLIVIDPISRFRDADENDNNAGTRFVQALQQLRVGINRDATLMSCHHANKGAEGNGASQNNSRGASSVVDGMRFILNMSHMTKTQQQKLFGTEKTRDDRYVELHLVKTNYTNFIDPLYLHVEDEGVLVPSNKPIGNHLNNQVLQKISEVSMTKSAFKLKYGQKDNVFGLSERPLVTKIDELKELGLIKLPNNKPMTLTDKGHNQLESDDDE